MAAAVACCIGCATSTRLPAHLQIVDQPTGAPPQVIDQHNATFAVMRGRYDRVAIDLNWTIDRLGWGTLRTSIPPSVREVTDRFDRARHDASPPAIPPVADLPPMSARMLTPSSATAVAWLWPMADGRIGVAIRVGALGDPTAEREFLRELAGVHAAPPRAWRSQSFRLPTGNGGE